jgi:hypothetical protein
MAVTESNSCSCAKWAASLYYVIYIAPVCVILLVLPKFGNIPITVGSPLTIAWAMTTLSSATIVIVLFFVKKYNYLYAIGMLYQLFQVGYFTYGFYLLLTTQLCQNAFAPDNLPFVSTLIVCFITMALYNFIFCTSIYLRYRLTPRLEKV